MFGIRRIGSCLLALFGTATLAFAQASPQPASPKASAADPLAAYPSSRSPLPVSLDDLPKEYRDTVKKIMKTPTILATAPAEEFEASHAIYKWMLDHPDRVALAWKRLRVGALDIKAMDGGRFQWQDPNGSELNWRTIAQSDTGRIWYAEGRVRTSSWLPSVPVKAVAVLRHRAVQAADGKNFVRHHVEVYIQTDSRMLSVAAKLYDAAVPKVAEAGAEQLLLFYSGIAFYVSREKDPAKREALVADKDR